VEEKKPVHVVVLGAGFGGLTFCQNFPIPTRALRSWIARIIICFNRCCTSGGVRIVCAGNRATDSRHSLERTDITVLFTRRGFQARAETGHL